MNTKTVATLRLNPSEQEALKKASIVNYRTITNQARHYIVLALIKDGFLPKEHVED